MPIEIQRQLNSNEIICIRKQDALSFNPVRIESPENPQPEQVLIKNEQLMQRINEMAQDIAKNHKDENLLVIQVLNGATIFNTHLVHGLNKYGLKDLQMDSIRAESYDNKKKKKFKIAGHPQKLYCRTQHTHCGRYC